MENGILHQAIFYVYWVDRSKEGGVVGGGGGGGGGLKCYA